MTEATAKPNGEGDLRTRFGKAALSAIRNRVFKDAHATFSKNNPRGGVMARNLYHGLPRGFFPTGATQWSRFTEKYPLPGREVELINAKLGDFSRLFADTDTLVDFGVGAERAVREKILTTLKACPNISTYKPVDYSPELLEGAVSVVKSEIPDMNVQPFHGDFFRRRIYPKGELKLGEGVFAGILYGSTISNVELVPGGRFPEEEFVKNIQSLASLIPSSVPGKKSVLAMSFDSTTNLEEAAKIYDTPVFHEFICGIMADIYILSAPEHRVNFDPFAWHYERIISPTNRVVHHCAIADRDQSITFPGIGSCDMEQGKGFAILNSFRLQPDQMIHFIKEAKQEPLETIRMDDPKDNPTVIQTVAVLDNG